MLVDGEERVGCREDLSGCHTRQLNRVILERVRQKDACYRVSKLDESAIHNPCI